MRKVAKDGYEFLKEVPKIKFQTIPVWKKWTIEKDTTVATQRQRGRGRERGGGKEEFFIMALLL